MTKRVPPVELYDETIRWPPQCVNCGDRPAVATVRLRGRFLFSGDLDVPYCRVCSDARRGVFARAVRYVLVSLAPIVIGGPFALGWGFVHHDDPGAATILLALTIGVMVWTALWTSALALSLRRDARRLGQVAVLSPIVVYRTFRRPLSGLRSYRLRILNDRVREYVLQHNRTIPDDSVRG